MAKELLMPEMAESVVEGEILKWLVEEGDEIKLEQPVVEVMTDKVTVELPSPFAGKLVKKLVKEGDIVAVHAPIALVEDGSDSSGVPSGGNAASGAATKDVAPDQAAADRGRDAATQDAKQAASDADTDISASASAVGSDYGTPQKKGKLSFGGRGSSQGRAAGAEAKAATNRYGRVLAVPAARQMARENGVDIAEIPGSGPNGRVGVDDVRAYLDRGTDGAAQAAPAQQAAQPAATAKAPATGGMPVQPVQYKTPKGYEGRETRTPLRGLRRAISNQMLASHLYTVRTLTVDEADMTELVALRGRTKEKAAARGVKLTYLPFIVKAAAAALKKFPNLNSSIDEAAQEIVRKSYYNLGIAVDTEAGLLVPVLRDVDSKSILEIAQNINDAAGRAREGKLTAEDSTGGTFSITNMGSAGSLVSFPIINAPEAAILGVHTIQERPVGRNGQIVLRQMMYLSLSFDHRIADGAEGARFLKEIVRLLENPDDLLLEGI
ncbi:pyruvate dehydrogenase E2 component (dihydrolipoamide acetyltransferase) [Deinobacterium chartae]|uniref:Dihydrolipoamide acetyltransferase component of pyruvate dehydrogenase complex n=1 Tax=Deinobacterium chartae TaxID=521158 RepID=A0A841HW59_9DEIO|nr:dihydrolipoamide acetyltransferase family protein [Deinobacterium chartae]MBB6097073.1 pyruvate dehydrogenase E2 component (dihydrolipoamide acetyltransferase) [Deinobacterium chartae]